MAVAIEPKRPLWCHPDEKALKMLLNEAQRLNDIGASRAQKTELVEEVFDLMLYSAFWRRKLQTATAFRRTVVSKLLEFQRLWPKARIYQRALFAPSRTDRLEAASMCCIAHDCIQQRREARIDCIEEQEAMSRMPKRRKRHLLRCHARCGAVASIRYSPCGHMVNCGTCASQMDQCNVCNAKIVQRVAEKW